MFDIRAIYQTYCMRYDREKCSTLSVKNILVIVSSCNILKVSQGLKVS